MKVDESMWKSFQGHLGYSDEEMNSLATMVLGVRELFYAGVAPNELRFKRFGCHDVGVRCGGRGHIVLEVRVADRNNK